MRNQEEIVSAALEARAKAIKEGGKWPEFVLTPDEWSLLSDQPLNWQGMMGLPERLCGLVVRTAPQE